MSRYSEEVSGKGQVVEKIKIKNKQTLVGLATAPTGMPPSFDCCGAPAQMCTAPYKYRISFST